MLAVCLNVDYRILFTPPTEGVVRDGFEFYATFYNAPPAIKVCCVPHPVLGFGTALTQTHASLRIFFFSPPWLVLCLGRGLFRCTVLPTLQALLHAIIAVGLVGLIGKLHKWDDSAVFFDGSSLGTSPVSPHFLPRTRPSLSPHFPRTCPRARILAFFSPVLPFARFEWRTPHPSHLLLSRPRKTQTLGERAR